jgi:uncharacterized membrane protein (DUF4010 family)
MENLFPGTEADTLLQLKQLGLALLLGLLIGLQRQKADTFIGGVRTFALIALLGAASALLASQYHVSLLWIGGLGVLTLIVLGNVAHMKKATPEPGMTTEAAMLLMYAVGALCVQGPWVVAVALAGGVAILLQFKLQLHGAAKKLADDDMKAIMKLVLIWFIILPLMPNESFGPFAVLNPYEIWLMVVLVMGISVMGYISYKLFGQQAGILLAGIMGGLISSTATTFGYARQAGKYPPTACNASIVIMIASAFVYLRVLLEIQIVAPEFLGQTTGPIMAMTVVSGLLSLVAWLWGRSSSESIASTPPHPGQFKSALAFGLMYAVVIFAAAAAKSYFGQAGLYTVALISGLTDMDAITLSVARMVKQTTLDPHTGWQLIILASISNLFFKYGIVAVYGSRVLKIRMAVLYGLAALTGLLVIYFWP